MNRWRGIQWIMILTSAGVCLFYLQAHLQLRAKVSEVYAQQDKEYERIQRGILSCTQVQEKDGDLTHEYIEYLQRRRNDVDWDNAYEDRHLRNTFSDTHLSHLIFSYQSCALSEFGIIQDPISNDVMLAEGIWRREGCNRVDMWIDGIPLNPSSWTVKDVASGVKMQMDVLIQELNYCTQELDSQWVTRTIVVP